MPIGENPNDLGGEINGCFGIVLPAIEYTLIPQILCDKTMHAGLLPPINNKNLLCTVVARGEYKDNSCLFKECPGVEAALLN